MIEGERERGRPSCEGLVDHGIMVENWQPAIGSEGRSPLLKNDSSGAKKCPDISRQTHTYTTRAVAKVMKLCSSTSLDSAQVITVQSCLSWDSEDWTGYFRMFDTSAKWGQSAAHSVQSSNALSPGSMSHTCRLPVVNVFICRLYRSSALVFIQDPPSVISVHAILHHLKIKSNVCKFFILIKNI